MPDRPNVLYLHAHDTGRHLQPYGYAVPTFHLQRLADQGTLYRNAFCISPTCSPSRAALLTGQYPHQCGQLGLSNAGYPLRHPERHWVHAFNAAGYATALMGVQHVTADERDLPFGYVRPEIVGYAFGRAEEAAHAESVADATCGWLREHGKGGPWMLDAGTLQTHTASWALLGDDELPSERAVDVARVPALLADSPEARAWYARHIVIAGILDRAVGRILHTLDELGLADNTLVLFTVDHGLGLPTAKCNLTDAGLEAALILRGPGFVGGRTVHESVTHLDVFPTLCELCGLDRPAWLEGTSLLGDPPHHPATFAQTNVHGSPIPARSVRTDRYKLIRRWHTPDVLAHNTDARPPKQRMTDHGWPHRFPPGRPVDAHATDVLFDLELDPTERHDRSIDPAYAKPYADLTQRLAEWTARTNDQIPNADDPIALLADMSDRSVKER
ncbi:MAG: sulfatase-like hydrolase/transferase [Planctomycetota bacterium]